MRDSDLQRLLLSGKEEDITQAIHYLKMHVLPQIIFWVKSMGGTKQDGEDVFWESMKDCTTYAYRSNFSFRKGAIVYIKKVCKNKWYKKYNKQMKFSSSLKDLQIREQQSITFDPDFCKKFIGMDKFNALKNSLYDDIDEEILTLHYVDGYTPKEIGEKLGMAANTVSKRLSRIREKLRHMRGSKR